MNIPDIPFNKHNGTHKTKKDIWSLSYSEEMSNYLRTINALTQFTLSEAYSGRRMLEIFSEAHEGIISVFRRFAAKYQEPTKSDIYASSSVDDRAIQSCRHNPTNKNSAFIPVQVKIKDKEHKSALTRRCS